MTYEDMAKLVTNDLGFGWRNVALIDQASAPTWSYQTTLSVPGNVTQETVHVYLACDDMTPGTAMRFQASQRDVNGQEIGIATTTISQSDQISGVTVELAPGFEATITVSYWANGKTNPSGSGIALTASIESGGNAALEALSDDDFVADFEHRLVGDGITPTRPVYLGDFRYRMT